jgi:hypothetical protein
MITFIPSPRLPLRPAARRAGVLLLVVLSMLTLFMLLGVTYLIMAARVRSTAKAFLRLADDQAQTAVTLTPLLKDAALQVMRGTGNLRSAIRGHDLLADKYGSSTSGVTVVARALVAGEQMLRLRLQNGQGIALTGRVLTYVTGPDGVANTSDRIVAADLVAGVPPQTDVWLPRPRRLGRSVAGINQITQVLINSRDFAGTGFSSTSPPPVSTGITSLNNSAFEPNTVAGGTIDTSAANEDYDAIDEQNWALAVADGTVRSFERPDVYDHLLRNYARANGITTENAAKSALASLATAQPTNVGLLPFRRATLRPFAYDHWQDTAGGTDFTGKSLSSFNVIVANPGDVDNDGDGSLDSIWLDLGYAAMLMPDRKYVKPLFAITCVDLGGRVNINAHGSPTHANESPVVALDEFAPRRNDDGTIRRPTWLRGGLGYGPADVRLDAVLDAANVTAAMLGSSSASGVGDGIRRDLGAIVGRYGDGVTAAATLARPGTPNQNDRRQGGSLLWTDRGLPDNYATRNGQPSLFGGRPPDMWSRLCVGLDHRGHPFHAYRSTVPVSETTDNPYELDLFRPKPGNGYAQPAATAMAYVDQPFTAAELEGILRAFDFDNAAALPPRGLALALSAASGAMNRNKLHVTTESWDTPAVVSTDLSFDATKHDPDLVAGLKMDLNRPFGDADDDDGDGLVDEPGETGDAYSGGDRTNGWYLTRFQIVPVTQPGNRDDPHLRARQLFAWHLFNLLDTLRATFAVATSADPGLRLFGISSDDDDDTTGVPQAIDPALRDPTPSIAIGRQGDHARKVLAQWAVNVVDFLDPDAIMTPFRYTGAFGTDGSQGVVWGCERPDLMVTETLAFHDRRTADTKCDPSQETTVEFKQNYQARYDAWMAWKNAGANPTTKPAYPNPVNPDGNPDQDDMDFDQVRIPEGSLFLELYAMRNPSSPNLPRELYSYDATANTWSLDLARVPAGGTEPVWRLAISKNHSTTPHNDVFKMVTANSAPGYTGNPETDWLSPGDGDTADKRGKVADSVSIDRYVWLSNDTALALPASGSGATIDNTFYVQDSSLPRPRLPPGGYLVVGPRATTAIGSIQGGVGAQKWGVPADQRIILNAGTPSAGNPAVGVYDLTGSPNPTVAVPTSPAARFGNPLPPPDTRPETHATWVAMSRPTSWNGTWNSSWLGNGRTGIGLNVSEPLRSSYYPCPTTRNTASGLHDAYGPLDNDTHASFPTTPVDRMGGSPIVDEMLSGGTFANFCTVFVERLADPTRPHQPDASNQNWNPYIVVDYMPIDLTVFNGETTAADPRETQGPDRQAGLGPIPAYPAPTTTLPTDPADPIDPAWVPLPCADTTSLAARDIYFHTRQRGFGKDLENYDNDLTLFGIGGGTVYRNPHPFKPIGSLADLTATPLRTASTPNVFILPGGRPTVARDGGTLPASQRACFLHELGQSPDGRSSPSTWRKIPYHSLGWVNPSFGRRLDTADGIPAGFAGCPDRPFPWLVWNDGPFANPYELLFVPRTPPGRLLTNFRNLDYPQGSDYQNVSRPYNTDDIFGACTPGAHLLPISAITDVPAPGSTRSRNADLFARLFEYLRVRSPFTGTDTVITGIGDDDRPNRFVGPFNRLPKYREPGRININTIHPDPGEGAAVWNALCGRETGSESPSYADIVAARAVSIPFTGGTANYRRPWRIASGTRDDFSNITGLFSNALVPAGWLSPPLGATGSPTEISDRFSVRSFTLLGDKPRMTTGAARREPLFPAPAADAWANDGSRDAWFRFETLVRANANATVRSEVYAIWVTMGLFEVAGSAGTLYPDGYRLVREYGSDTGDVTRHRAFYIFDRSIPVGFEQGQNHNIQDAILVERFIE